MTATKLEYPFNLGKIKALKLGELVAVSGRINSGRDRVHKHLFDGGHCPVDLKDGAIFHAGPLILRQERMWIAQAAGPTTSMREEPYMARIIEKHKIRVIIGKGGMGKATEKACSRFGCVYLETVGGIAQVLNQKIERVAGVHFRHEFGSAEALWELDVIDFPALVSIDASGKSLHKRIRSSSKRVLTALLRKATPFKG